MVSSNVATRSCFFAALIALLGTAGHAVSMAGEPCVQIQYPEMRQYYSGITEAAGTAISDTEVPIASVYCHLYYYEIGDYRYRYWNWQTQEWQIGSSRDTLKRAEFDPDTGAWRCAGGFPTSWEPSLSVAGAGEPSRTYAFNPLAYTTSEPINIFRANVAYFYIAIDDEPPMIDLTILSETLEATKKKEMVLAAEVSVVDLCDPDPDVTINVSSSGHDNGSKQEPDWEIVEAEGTWQIWLRAETQGLKEARVYTIAVASTDADGNTATALDTVTILPWKTPPGLQKRAGTLFGVEK